MLKIEQSGWEKFLIPTYLMRRENYHTQKERERERGLSLWNLNSVEKGEFIQRDFLIETLKSSKNFKIDFDAKFNQVWIGIKATNRYYR